MRKRIEQFDWVSKILARLLGLQDVIDDYLAIVTNSQNEHSIEERINACDAILMCEQEVLEVADNISGNYPGIIDNSRETTKLITMLRARLIKNNRH